MIKLRRRRWTGHAERIEEKRNAYRIVMGQPEVKRPPGRPRHWGVENNTRIKMDLREIGWGGMDLIWLRIRNSRGFL
jgi:hypothetical protein